MKKIKLILFPLVLLFSFVLLGSVVQVNAERKVVDVEIVTYFDETNQLPAKTVGKTYGTKFKFNADLGENPGYEFSFWIVNGKVRNDLALDSDFVVTDNMTLKGIFKPVGEHAVVFMDANGNVLKVQHLAPGADANDLDITTLPDKPGYDVAIEKWDKDLTNVQADTVYTLQYTRKVDADTPVLSVVGGTVNGLTEDIFGYNDVATVVANAPAEGKFFSHWQIGKNIVSRQSTYSFTMVKETTITAVYADATPADLPLVALSDKLALREGYNSFMGQFYIPEGYTLVEYGMLTSNEPGLLVVDTIGVRKNLGKKYFEQTNEWLMSFPINGSANVRAYLVCENISGELVTVYNEVILDEYNVTFNTDSGDAISNQVVVEGNKATEPSTPAKSGFEFAGWFRDLELLEVFDFNTIITGDITLYAKWNVIVVRELFISEYGEGSSNNKWIELYNPTNETINLSQYSVKLFTNGASTSSNIQTLTGNLASKGTYVLYNNQASSSIILDKGNLSSTKLGFNGDDALALYKNDILIDQFGIIGNDPGSNWSVGTGSTADNTLIRKIGIVSPSSTWDEEQWDVYPQDTFDYIGSHTAEIINPESINVTGVLELLQGNSITLSAIVNPAGASQDVIWLSSNTAIATVDNNGKVTGVSAGTVTITVSSLTHPEILITVDITVQGLDQAKADAKAEIDDHITLLEINVYYSATDIASINGFVNDAKTNIDNALNMTEINTIVAEAINNINSIRTIEERYIDSQTEIVAYFEGITSFIDFNLELPVSAVPHVEYIWTFSPVGIFDNNGVFTQPANDTVVTVTIDIYMDGVKVNESVTQTVTALAAISDTDLFNFAIEDMDIKMPAFNAEISSDMTLPSAHPDYTKLTYVWTSQTPTAISDTGVYMGPETNTSVTFIVEVFNGTESIGTHQYTVIAKAQVKYTVTFNVDGGSPIDNQIVIEGNLVVKPEAPTKDGFTFVRWCSDAGLGTEYVFTDSVTANIELYAKWEEEAIAEPTILYQTGFEAGAGFVASTNYNNTSIKEHGNSSNLWGVMSGSPTKTSPMEGLQQIQMRYYTTAPTVIGYLRTMFTISNVTKIDFMAKGTKGNNVSIAYSYDGNSWTDVETITLSTTETSYTCNISATGAIYLKLQLVLPGSPVTKSDLLIDDVKIWGNA